MTYTDVYVYNESLGQYMHIGLPGIVYRDMKREDQIESMRRIADPEMAELLEKYDFVVDGLKWDDEIPKYKRCKPEEVRTFMESYPVDITIRLPEDFLVRDLAKIFDILSEYDDEPDYFSWDKDTVQICGEPSDIAEHMKEDILMLYPDLEIEIDAVVDKYDEAPFHSGE